jgi:hypothetical protein
MNGNPEEVTGWRDEALSRRHRAWGVNCPAQDVDLVLVEYDRSEPVALVEYTRRRKLVDGDKSKVTVLFKLAERSRLPAFVVRYTADLATFAVEPASFSALKWVAREGAVMSERDFVRLLYRLRGRSLPAEIEVTLAGDRS